MGKDLDMWEIIVIIARHIQNYMIDDSYISFNSNGKNDG